MFLSYLLPELIHSLTVTTMGATALVPLILSLTLLSKKAVDLADKEIDKSEKVSVVENI